MWAPGFINGDATAWGTTVSNITLALTFSPTPTPVKVWTFFLANAEKGDFINLLVPTTGSVSPPILHLSVPTMVHSSHLRWKSVGAPVSASVLTPPPCANPKPLGIPSILQIQALFGSVAGDGSTYFYSDQQPQTIQGVNGMATVTCVHSYLIVVGAPIKEAHGFVLGGCCRNCHLSAACAT